MTPARRRWLRIRGFLRKEALQIRRDPSSIALALVMPVVLLFLFGFGVSLDTELVPIALILDDRGPEARALAAKFQLSPYFEPVHAASYPSAVRQLDRGAIACIVRIESNFSETLERGEPAPVQVIVDGTNATRANLVRSYVQGVLGVWSNREDTRGREAPYPRATIEQRVWFNEDLDSTNFLVPGLVALVMTLTGVLLTALVIAREWERGTMEAILATPISIAELMLGKVVPYYVLGLLGLGISVAFGMLVFGVPLRGSLVVLFLLSTLFLLASLGLGLFISALARVQFAAAQASLVAGFLPALFLSGMLFDLESTPAWIQVVSRVVPARYFVSAAHTIFLAGDVWAVLWPDALALALMAVVFLGLARTRLNKRLDG